MKTAGVIRGIKTNESMKSSRVLRDWFDFHEDLEKIFKNSGYSDIEVRKIASKCIICDGDIYYMYNIKSYLFYQQHKDRFENSSVCKDDYQRLQNEYNEVNKIRQYINVIEYISY